MVVLAQGRSRVDPRVSGSFSIPFVAGCLLSAGKK
jgi:hypothetical protein